MVGMVDIVIELLSSLTYFGLVSCALTLSSFIIAYEQQTNDRLRTAVNKISASYVSIFRIAIVAVTIVIICKFFVHELPHAICYLYSALQQFCMIMLFLSFNQALIIQLLFACYYQSLVLLKEDLTLHFFNWCKLIN